MIQLQYQVNLCQSFYQIKIIKRLAKLLKAFLSKYKIRLVKQKKRSKPSKTVRQKRTILMSFDHHDYCYDYCIKLS